MVDHEGSIIDGDKILAICGKYLKDQKELENDTIVTTVMSNLGLYKACDKIGIKYEKTAVGDKYVNENMVANNYVLGGEQSGHIIFSKHATTGDGILTSLKIMEAVIESKSTLSALASPVVIYPQILKNVKVKNKSDVMNDEKVKLKIEEIEKLLGNDGRVLVRESGTEPVIRVMVEAPLNEICNKYIEEIIDVIDKQGYLL